MQKFLKFLFGILKNGPFLGGPNMGYGRGPWLAPDGSGWAPHNDSRISRITFFLEARNLGVLWGSQTQNSKILGGPKMILMFYIEKLRRRRKF